MHVIENPVQQVQMQKGEHASSWLSSCGIDLLNSYLMSSVSFKDSLSAQGIMLKPKTRKAIMNATIFFTAAKVNAQNLKRKLKTVAVLQAAGH